MSAKYTPLLHGIGFTGYRSFATEWQPIEFPSKVTVLAGINNSGKSNVLGFLQNVLPGMKSRSPAMGPRMPHLEGLDRPLGFPSRAKPRVGIPISLAALPSPSRQSLASGDPHSQDVADWQRYAMHLLREDDFFWAIFEGEGGDGTPPTDRVQQAIAAWPNWRSRAGVALRLLGGGPVDPVNVMARILTWGNPFSSIPDVVTIDSSRRVESTPEESSSDQWLSGRGIVQALARLQSPPHDAWLVAREQWQAINRFVQVVLDDDSASINIPHDASTIQVETPRRVLPLANLGSGIEQVVILAAAATVTQRRLVCIEEPESNLHPLLQKKLIRYLVDETDNQYVIATHSSHLLDDSRATAYHLRLTDNGTTSQRARRPHELVTICNDLGYRPSDLLQANCVLWVEGPSDRIYLRAWLALLAPELAEGIDYSIMFYGGKLLSHLAVDAEALQDFIDLRRLNRASAVLIDSDRTNSRQRLSATKRRIQSEYANDPEAPGLVWVTKCYTIENYLQPDLLQEAVHEVHPGRRIDTADHWSNPLKPAKGQTPYDKIAIARSVEGRLESTDLDRLDLRARLQDVAAFIRKANG